MSVADRPVQSRNDSAEVFGSSAEAAALHQALQSSGAPPMLRAMFAVSFHEARLRPSPAQSAPGSLLACVVALYLQRSRRVLTVLALAEAHEAVPLGLGSTSGRIKPRRRRRLARAGLAEYAKKLSRKKSERTPGPDLSEVDLEVNFKEDVEPYLKEKLGAGAFGVVFKVPCLQSRTSTSLG